MKVGEMEFGWHTWEAHRGNLLAAFSIRLKWSGIRDRALCAELEQKVADAIDEYAQAIEDKYGLDVVNSMMESLLESAIEKHAGKEDEVA